MNDEKIELVTFNSLENIIDSLLSKNISTSSKLILEEMKCGVSVYSIAIDQGYLTNSFHAQKIINKALSVDFTEKEINLINKTHYRLLLFDLIVKTLEEINAGDYSSGNRYRKAFSVNITNAFLDLPFYLAKNVIRPSYLLSYPNIFIDLSEENITKNKYGATLRDTLFINDDTFNSLCQDLMEMIIGKLRIGIRNFQIYDRDTHNVLLFEK